METEVTKITSNKPKDPKRVEAGKRLAAISKAAKERKKMERTQLSDSDWSINYSYVIGTAGVIVAIVSLYYVRKADNRDEVISKCALPDEEEKKLDSFD